MQTTPPLKVLRIIATSEKTGVSVPQIYDWMAKGTFPKAIAISKHARGWLEHELDAWIQARIDARDEGSDAALRVTSPNIGKGRQDLLALKQAAPAAENRDDDDDYGDENGEAEAEPVRSHAKQRSRARAETIEEKTAA